MLAGVALLTALAVPSALADGGTGGVSVTGAPGGAGGTGFAAPGNDGRDGGNDCSFGISAGGGGAVAPQAAATAATAGRLMLFAPFRARGAVMAARF